MNRFIVYSWLWLGMAFIGFLHDDKLWVFTSITNSTVWLAADAIRGTR